ncbi:S-adenosyl-L-methionine-dependent methyltransferase [Aspergillus navahoensis]
MTGQALENDVPMQGAGFYNANSDLQAAGMHRALPLFDNIPSTTASVPFSVVEYGCAQGANSILPFKRILHARYIANRSTSGEAEETDQEALLTFSDREGNDFNTLVQTIAQSQWLPTDQSSQPQPKILTSMVAGTFYDRLVPRDSVDVGFSLATLHHLERLPTANGEDSTKIQAHEDLVRFLSLRAQEFRRGGSLVLSFVSHSSTGAPNYPELVDACRQAMIQMVGAQRISPQVAGAFHVPTHDRTMEEVKRSLAVVNRLWHTEQVFEEEIVHPAYDRLLQHRQSTDRKENENETEKASRWYAETVVDWMMAVIAGYFVKALQSEAPELDAAARERLLSEWRNRTKEGFYQQYRDCKHFDIRNL